MTKVFKTVDDVQMQGIAFGDAWVFDGFPDPITEGDDPDKWEKEMAKAEDTFAKIEAAIAEIIDDANNDNGNNGQGNGNRTVDVG